HAPRHARLARGGRSSPRRGAPRTSWPGPAYARAETSSGRSTARSQRPSRPATTATEAALDAAARAPSRRGSTRCVPRGPSRAGLPAGDASWKRDPEEEARAIELALRRAFDDAEEPRDLPMRVAVHVVKDIHIACALGKRRDRPLEIDRVVGTRRIRQRLGVRRVDDAPVGADAPAANVHEHAAQP